MSSCVDFGEYANEVLAKQMAQEGLAEVRAIKAKKDFANPCFMKLLMPNFYEKHILRALYMA